MQNKQGGTRPPEVTRPQSGEFLREIEGELHRCGYLDVHGLFCEFDQGVLTLGGRVSSYYLKQIAQTVALKRLQGTVAIRNELVVRSR